MLSLLIVLAVATDPGPPIRDAALAEELARMLRGKTVIVRDTMMNVDDVSVVRDPAPNETTYALHAQVSPLFEVRGLAATYAKDPAAGVAHYTLQLSKQCGSAAPGVAPGRAVVIDAANALILEGDRFRWFGELASPDIRQRVELYVNPQQLIAPSDRARVQECARQRARAATDRSHALTMFVGDERRAVVRVGVDPRTVLLDGDVGEDWANLRIVVTPAAGIVVERQSVSIMQCSNEGPHVELYDWKRGVTAWKPLTARAAGEFVVDSDADPFHDAPPFPKYTPAELAKVKPDGFATESCAPVVGIVRLRVRFGAETLQTIEIMPAMGC